MGRSGRSIPTGQSVLGYMYMVGGIDDLGCQCFQGGETVDGIWASVREVSQMALEGRLIYREAACRQHANELNDATNAFHNAAKSYKKSDPEGKYHFGSLCHGNCD